MNKQYFENWLNKIDKGEDENMTQDHRKLCFMYEHMLRDERDYMTVNSVDNVNNIFEFVKLMREADVNEIYIVDEWSNQFANWYEWQEAGLKMCGIVKVDNPKYLKDMKKYGDSLDSPTRLLLKFSL